MRPSEYASGFLVFRKQADSLEFLLMRHANRWDLPKGRLDFGESKKQAAIRELEEETGITPDEIWIDPDFVYENQYWVTYTKQVKPKLKELSIFLAFLKSDRDLVLTEHTGYEWMTWAPPHAIQNQTIDPLLAKVASHLQSDSQLDCQSTTPSARPWPSL